MSAKCQSRHFAPQKSGPLFRRLIDGHKRRRGAATDAALSADSTIKLVAAENFYGDIAHQIGGREVEVVSVLTNPYQDPHLFETSASVVR